MLTKEEIIVLRQKVAERSQRLEEDLHGGSPDIIAKRTKALAALFGTPGWEIIEESVEKMICELLVPEESTDMSAEAYQINGEAKRLAIQAIQSFIGSVRAAADASAATVMADSEETPMDS